MPERTSRIRNFFRYLMPARSALLLVAYGVLFSLSLYLAYELKYDFEVPEPWTTMRAQNLTWIVPLKLALFFSFGLFGGLLSYFRLPDLFRIVGALSASSAFLIYSWYVFDGLDCPPRSVILGDFLFSLLLVTGFRMGLRIFRERFFSASMAPGQTAKRVAIIGAGDAGATIAADLMMRRGLGMRPVVFLDDDSKKWRKTIHGVPVMDSPDNLAAVKNQFGVDEIIIAMPSASAMRIREIITEARRLNVRAEIVPSLQELATGKVRASRIRPVQIEDLLGRDSVHLDSDSIATLLKGQVVAVTGAGGSIGTELCRQIATRNPKRLLLLDQSEIQLFQTEQALIEDGFSGVIVPIICDILDEDRVRTVFERYSPQILFHAAAHKHVPMMERQPGEALKNNTLGTARLADLASATGIGRFVLISTDKAINPTSVMGASKRMAEIYLQSRQSAPGNVTRFMAVRFGNVLGSSGSVVPIFKKQIANGGPVKVTHTDVTRYFMTIPEAVGLVLQCATQGQGGEIFVLDMGDPIKIIDLARQMIELSGFRPDIDIPIEIIGLRPGEKLFEELRHDGETYEETQHPRIMRFICEPTDFDSTTQQINEIASQIDQRDPTQHKELLRRFVPEYTPHID